MRDIKDIRFLIPSIFILALVGIVIGIAAWSSTGLVEVKVQVTPQYSVTVGDAAINYGALALSGTKDTLTLGDTQTATNDGSTAEKLNIMGSNSTPDAWQLSATGAQGNNIYFHKFATDGATWNNLATSGYAVLRASLAQNATQGFDLYIGVPSTTSATATQDVDVTVQATAPD